MAGNRFFMRHTLLRFTLLLAATFVVCACDQGKPNDHPEDQAESERRASTQPAPQSAIEISDPLAGMKKRADAGDVNAMITLGRTFESLGTPATSPSTNPARDLSRLRWQEVLESVDTKDFVSVANPSYTPKKGVVPPAFFGLCTAPDKTLMIAGTGPSGDDIQ